jgi:hypothetical protein
MLKFLAPESDRINLFNVMGPFTEHDHSDNSVINATSYLLGEDKF